jgi:hypothetical protein
MLIRGSCATSYSFAAKPGLKSPHPTLMRRVKWPADRSVESHCAKPRPRLGTVQKGPFNARSEPIFMQFGGRSLDA